MFCIKCGKELSENAFICPNCGELISNHSNQQKKRILKSTVSIPSTNTVINQQVNPPSTNNEQKKNIYAVLGFILALISIAFAVIYLTFNILLILNYFFSIAIYDYSFHFPIIGILIVFLAIASLTFSILGICSHNFTKRERAFALTGIIISSIVLVLLMACYFLEMYLNFTYHF